MDINRYMVKAKTLRTREWVTGYYYKMTETTHCTINDCPPVPVHHYILQETMTDPLTLRDGREVHASELKLGDKILINSNQYSEETTMFNIDKAWLLGFMLCDGCYQNNHIFASIAAIGEDEIEHKFHDTFTKYFGLKTKTVLQERGKKGTYKDLYAIADDNGGLQYTINYFSSKFGGINKANRQIPNEIFSWNYEAKLAFLAGMIDADGYINSHQKKRYLFYYSDVDKILFANRLEALTLVTDAEKDKPKVSNERFYEED